MSLIAVDFDGTIVEHKYPEIGEALEGAFETLQDLITMGHRLILNTCREDSKKRKYLTEAVDFCKENGVEFVSINENCLDDEFRDENSLRRKVYAHLYIDDRNLGGFPGWLVVRQHFNLPPIRPRNEDLHEQGLDSGSLEPPGEIQSLACETRPGCLGAL